MHKLQMYESLMEMLEREVKEITNKGNLDQQSLDILYKIMLSIKAIDKHVEMMNGQGMSQGRSYESRESRDSYGRSYDGSYARRGRDGDGDGRYSEDSYGYSRNSGRGSYGSYEYSRDGATDAMRKRLEAMMNEPVSENTRLALMDCLNKIS